MKKLLLVPTALFALALSAGAVLPSAEKVLPDDTLVMISIPDFAKALNIYNSSPQVRLWNDPAMKPFRDKLMDKVKSEYLTPLEHDLGVHFDDYTSLPQGQLTFALTQDGWQGKDNDDKNPGVLLLLDTRDKSSQLKSNLTDLRKKWVDAGKPVKAEKIRDVEFSVISPASSDLPKTLKALGAGGNAEKSADDKAADTKKEAKTQIYIGQSDSTLLMANSPRVLEKVLAAMSGGSVKTLADVPAFSASQNSMFRDSPIYGWANAGSFVGLLAHSADGASAAAGMPDPGKIISAVGLNGVKTLAFSYQFSDDGALFNFMLGVPESSRTGIFKLLAGEPKEFNPPPFVPADAVKFQRWRIDGQKVWAGIRAIAQNVSPESVGGLDFMLNSAEAAAKEKNPDFDLKKNLFGNLGDDFITYQKIPRGDTLQELASPPALYLIGSPNAEQLANALKSLMILMPQPTPPAEREFNGHKIYSIAMSPGMPASDSAKPQTNALSYAFSGGYLAISTDTPILEEYLRSSESQGKSLRDTPGLTDATQKVGGSGTSLFGYSNEAETMRVLFNLLKKDNNSADSLLGPLAMIMDDTNLKDWVDISLLPTFDKISKYFYFSVYTGSATPDGLSLKAYAPVPPQLKK
jgi:hypothetical protein